MGGDSWRKKRGRISRVGRGTKSNLEHKLRDLDGVRRGAVARR